MQDTKEIHSQDFKKYTKERYLLHKRIMSQIEKPSCSPKIGERPLAILIGGGTASGKTTIRKKIIENKLGSKSDCTTVVDFDAIKEYIPEYSVLKKMDINQATTLVHKESRDIGTLLLNKLIDSNKNFIFEATMARTKWYRYFVNRLKEQGYEIHAYVIDVPLKVAKKRAKKRERLTGRKVPDKIIKNTHRLIPRTFIEIKNLVDRYYIYDNQNGLALIASNHYFFHPQKYTEFLKKGQIERQEIDNSRLVNKDLLIINKYYGDIP